VNPCLQVIFPERPGALIRFLNMVCTRWNITLFHYRNTGNRESSVLMGLQVSGVFFLSGLVAFL
jgi:threonine dehydratase